MKRTNLYFELIMLAIIAFPIAFAVYQFPNLPDTIVTHYNLKGGADGFAEKNFAYYLILPGINLMLNLFMFAVPGMIPDEQKAPSTLRILQATRFATAILLSGIAVFMVTSAALHDAPNIERWIGGGLFLLMLLPGNYMKEIKPNDFAGVRNSYTLEDPGVRKRTHRRASYLFFYTGWVGITAAFVIDIPYFLLISIAVLIILCIASSQISRIEHQKKHG